MGKHKMPKTKCVVCGKKVLSFLDKYCSIECMHYDLEYQKIILPIAFLRRLAFRLNVNEKYIELDKFAQRHNYQKELVFKKANDLIKELER